MHIDVDKPVTISQFTPDDDIVVSIQDDIHPNIELIKLITMT